MRVRWSVGFSQRPPLVVWLSWVDCKFDDSNSSKQSFLYRSKMIPTSLAQECCWRFWLVQRFVFWGCVPYNRRYPRKNLSVCSCTARYNICDVHGLGRCCCATQFSREGKLCGWTLWGTFCGAFSELGRVFRLYLLVFPCFWGF